MLIQAKFVFERIKPNNNTHVQWTTNTKLQNKY